MGITEYVFYCKGGLHLFILADTLHHAALYVHEKYKLDSAVLLEVNGRRAINSLTVLDLLR